MTNQQLFVLIFTFLVGMAAGAYMYATSFAPQYSADEVAEVDTDLTIIGEQIGGCQMVGVCATFRLDSKRNFSYLPAHALSADTPEPVDGKITRPAFAKLNTILDDVDFVELQALSDECQAAADGIDYVYQVTYAGEEYDLNSCGTAFYGSRLYNQLLVMWGEMIKHAEGEPITTDEDIPGAADLLINRFGQE